MNLTEKDKQIRNARREIVLNELKKGIIIPISMELFKKTDAEKSELMTAKHNHKKEMRKHGFNPSNRINISEPTTIHYRVFN